MNDRETAVRDLSRYLEDTSGKVTVPYGTALHVLPHTASDTGGTFDPEGVAIRARAAQAATGIEARYVAAAPWSHMPFRFLHGVPWTEFPVLAPPRFMARRNHMCGLYGMQEERAIRPLSFPLEEVLRRVSAVVVHPDPAWATPKAAESMLAMADVLHAGAVTDLFLAEGGTVSRTTPEALSAPYMGELPRKRFEYNFSVNFRAIAGKALVHALRETLDTADTTRETRDGIELASDRDQQARLVTMLEAGHYRGLDSPVLLQMLFRLRRLGTARLWADAGSGQPSLFEKDEDGLLWDGRGKSPKASFGIDEVMGIQAFNGGTPLLMSRDADGMRRLTPAGEMFLDLLHPVAEDPESLCRWAGRPLDQSDSDAMDRWIERTFRKVKTRVNAAGL